MVDVFFCFLWKSNQTNALHMHYAGCLIVHFPQRHWLRDWSWMHFSMPLLRLSADDKWQTSSCYANSSAQYQRQTQFKNVSAGWRRTTHKKQRWMALDLLCVYCEMNNERVYEMQCNLLPNSFDLLKCGAYFVYYHCRYFRRRRRSCRHSLSQHGTVQC